MNEVYREHERKFAFIELQTNKNQREWEERPKRKRLYFTQKWIDKKPHQQKNLTFPSLISSTNSH